MNVASPSSSATSVSQVARSRLVSSRGSPVPPDSDRVSGVVMFRRPGSAPPQTGAVPAKRAAASSRLVVAGQDRHRPGPGAAHGDDHAAGPADHVGTADGAQVAADQPRAGAQADQPGRPHPPRAQRAARPPAPGTRRSPPRCTAAWPAPAAAPHPAGKAAGITRRAMNRRFVRRVRRATPDSPGAQRANRSITDGCSSTSGTGSRPSPIA